MARAGNNSPRPFLRASVSPWCPYAGGVELNDPAHGGRAVQFHCRPRQADLRIRVMLRSRTVAPDFEDLRRVVRLPLADPVASFFRRFVDFFAIRAPPRASAPDDALVLRSELLRRVAADDFADRILIRLVHTTTLFRPLRLAL